MRRERFLRLSIVSPLIIIILILSGSSTPSFGQSGPVSGSCNQPLANPVTHFDIVDGHPVRPISTGNGCWIFVTVSGGRDGQGIAVLRRTATGIERAGFVRLSDQPRSMTLTPDDKTLLVGTGRNLALLDVARLIGGKSDSLMGYVGNERFGGNNSFAVTADGKYVFISHAATAWLSIIDLEKARVSPDPAAIIGGMPLAGFGGLALSPDGLQLYVVNNTLNDPSLVPGAKDWPLTCGDRQGSPNSPRQREGALLVLDVQRAVTNPSSAIVGAVRAGCWPGGLVLSPDGSTIYVASTSENAVLAFDTRSRQTPSLPSFIGKASVGPSPLGMATIHGGTKIVVANSNQWQPSIEPQTLTVLDASKMAAGSSAVLGTIPSGATPRQIHVTADGRTLFVANDGSSTLQIIDLDRLALAMKPTQQALNACNQPAADPITDFKIDGIPRFALPSQDGCWVYLRVDNFTENKTTTSGVAVLRRDSGSLRLVRYLSIPGVHDTMAFTPNQKMLIVKADRQIAVLDVDALKSGIGTPVRGYINDIHFTITGGPQTGPMPVSRDGKYLFVSQHSLAWISIIDLQKVEAGVFGAEAVAGGFPTEIFPSGITISPDDKYLFINTGGPPPALDPTPRCRDSSSRSATDPLVAPRSALSVIDIGKAFSSPASSLVSAASTGCSTAPHSMSPDGKTLYTVAHGDNTLLALDIRPSTDGGKAPILIGSVPVGSLPRDLIVVDGGKKVIVANSNQLFGTATDTETLTVIDTAKIASGAEAVLGTIRVGADPRYLSVTHDGRTIFVSNFKSRTLQMIDIERLPLQPAKQ